jgi:hypothetical protein
MRLHFYEVTEACRSEFRALLEANVPPARSAPKYQGLLVDRCESASTSQGPSWRCSTALSNAINAVFHHPFIARCQFHKIRNLKRHLPEKVFKVVERRMRDAYRTMTPSPARATSKRSQEIASVSTRPLR